LVLTSEEKYFIFNVWDRIRILVNKIIEQFKVKKEKDALYIRELSRGLGFEEGVKWPQIFPKVYSN
jgi:hypothetical protein